MPVIRLLFVGISFLVVINQQRHCLKRRNVAILAILAILVLRGKTLERLFKSGIGWRIGWNPQADTYQGLVGGDNWAIELTEAELHDFCRLLEQLSETMNQMAQELMDEERIACEAESDLLWMEVEGYPNDYSLRLILNQGRRCEGNWSKAVVSELLQAAQMLKSTFCTLPSYLIL